MFTLDWIREKEETGVWYMDLGPTAVEPHTQALADTVARVVERVKVDLVSYEQLQFTERRDYRWQKFGEEDGERGRYVAVWFYNNVPSRHGGALLIMARIGDKWKKNVIAPRLGRLVIWDGGLHEACFHPLYERAPKYAAVRYSISRFK